MAVTTSILQGSGTVSIDKLPIDELYTLVPLVITSWLNGVSLYYWYTLIQCEMAQTRDNIVQHNLQIGLPATTIDNVTVIWIRFQIFLFVP